MYKILIVDDERLIREYLKIIIKKENLPLELAGEAENGQDALELIKESLPDIVITDIRMPLMSGIELLRNSQGINAGIKFIVLSGYAEFEYAREAISFGVTEYVLKPIKSSEIAQAVMKACSEIDKIRKMNSNLVNNKELEKENTILRIENCLNVMIFSGERNEGGYSSIISLNPQFEGKYFVLGIFHIGHPQMYKLPFLDDDFNLLKYSVRSILEEHCTGNMILFNNFRDKTEILLLCFDDLEKDAVCNCSIYADNCCMSISKGICAVMTVGISNSNNNLFQLCKCYEEAKFALAQRFASGSNKVYCYGDVISIYKPNLSFPEHKLKTLEICLHHADSINALQDIQNAVNDIFSGENLNGTGVSFLQALFIKVIKIITHFCECRSINILDFIDGRAASGEIISIFSNNSNINDYIYSLIVKIIESSRPMFADEKQLVRDVKEYMKTHLHKDIYLDNAAKKFGADSKHLSKVFKSITGQFFNEYLEKIRLDRAKSLLEHTGRSIHDIALSAGYQDHQYFHRVFKKRTGMTPNEYRQENAIKHKHDTLD